MTAHNVQAESFECSRVLPFNLSPADESLSNCYILLFVSRTFDDPKAMPLSEDKVIRKENEGRRGGGEDRGLLISRLLTLRIQRDYFYRLFGCLCLFAVKMKIQMCSQHVVVLEPVNNDNKTR